MSELYKAWIPEEAVDFYNQLHDLSKGWKQPSPNDTLSVKQIKELYKAHMTISKAGLDSEVNSLWEKLYLASWPHVKSDKTGRRLFGIDNNLWYSTLVRVFRDWRSYVIEKYEEKHFEAIRTKYNDEHAKRKREYHEFKAFMFDLRRDPDTIVASLYWWLTWFGFTLSEDDIMKHVMPRIDIYKWHGDWRRHPIDPDL